MVNATDRRGDKSLKESPEVRLIRLLSALSLLLALSLSLSLSEPGHLTLIKTRLVCPLDKLDSPAPSEWPAARLQSTGPLAHGSHEKDQTQNQGLCISGGRKEAAYLSSLFPAAETEVL